MSTIILVNRATGQRRACVKRPTRVGKTKRDHASGSWKARFANREARVNWQQDSRATNDTFPGGGK